MMGPMLRTTLGYLCSCGLLLIPAMVWNGLFVRRLPRAFQPESFNSGIPPWLSSVENGARLLVFLLPFAMPLELASGRQRMGALVFAAGTAVYFASWLPLMLAPESVWSRSRWGFLAPAYTPAVWLLGLALLGQRLFGTTSDSSWVYLACAAAFLAAHVAHAKMVFDRVR
jgi:hypothetical protein